MTVGVTADCCLPVSIHVPSGCDSNALTKSPPGIEQRMCVTSPCATVLVITQQSSDALSASQMYRKKTAKIVNSNKNSLIPTIYSLFGSIQNKVRRLVFIHDGWWVWTYVARSKNFAVLWCRQRSVDCSPHVSRNVFWCYRNLIGRWKARRHSFIYRSSFPFNLLWVNSIVGWAVNNPYSSSWKNISWKYRRHLQRFGVAVCVCVCVCLCRSLGTKTRVIGMVYFEFWNMIPCWT